MNNITRLEHKLEALKAVTKDFNSEVATATAQLKQISIAYASKIETADKSTKAALKPLVAKLDKIINTLCVLVGE